MWTLSTKYYMKISVFREGSFFLLPPDKEMNYMTHLFHLCPEGNKYVNDGDPIGCIFTDPHAEKVECYKCHQSPGDAMITVHALLKGA